MLLSEIKDIDQEMATSLPRWIKARNANARNKSYEFRVPKETKQLAEKIKTMIHIAYPRSRTFTNYLAKTISIKVDKPNFKDVTSPITKELNQHLLDEYGIVPRSVGNASIIYHIPYIPIGTI